jgi:hypothetical protein
VIKENLGKSNVRPLLLNFEGLAEMQRKRLTGVWGKEYGASRKPHAARSPAHCESTLSFLL